MEQFVLLHASVYDKSLNTQSVTKQQLPNYPPLIHPTYRVDTLNKEINIIFFAKADSFVHKTLL